MNINQTLNGFRSYIESQGGIPHLNRFAVEIPYPNSLQNKSNEQHYDNVLKNLQFTVRSANIPSKTISTNAVMAAGPEQKYPYQDVYEDLTATFITTKGTKNFALSERKFFEDWMSSVINEENMLAGFPNGPNGYSVPLKLSVLSDERGSPSRLVQYEFSRTYPIGLGAIKFSQNSDELMLFDVTFSYDKWKRVDMKDNGNNPASVLPEPKNGETPLADRKPKEWNKKKETPLADRKPKEWAKKKEAPLTDRIPKEWDKKKEAPLTDRKVGGQAPSVAPPKKFIQKIQSRATNLVKEKLGIRPMLDE